jgi:TolB-like protein
VEDVVEALRGSTVGSRDGRCAGAWPGPAASSALLLGTLGYRLATRAPWSLAPAAVKARRSVAVLGFKNLTGRPEAAWMSAALSEMLTSELAAGEKLRTIPGENVARMQIELKVADPDSLAPDTLARIRERLGTDLVVLGSFLAAGWRLRLDIRVQDAAAGEVVATVTDTGEEEKILDLVSRTGAQLRGKLGVEELSPAAAGGARASLPSSPEGARLYAEGLARLRVFDALGAHDLLEKAAAADPGYPMVHSALAAAWTALGYEEKAREEAKRALDLAEKLSREDRLSVEGRYREATKEWDKAAAHYQTLFVLFPDNLDYGLRLASAHEGWRREEGPGRPRVAAGAARAGPGRSTRGPRTGPRRRVAHGPEDAAGHGGTSRVQGRGPGGLAARGRGQERRGVGAAGAGRRAEGDGGR